MSAHGVPNVPYPAIFLSKKERHPPLHNVDGVFVWQGRMAAASPTDLSTPFVLLMVADGMGGQGHGQVASRLAVQSLVEYVLDSLGRKQISAESLLSLLSAGVQYANQVIYERNRQQHMVMGTTMTAVLLIESTAYVAHVGNSRFYLYCQTAGLMQITRDHSVVAALVEAGDIEPEDIYMHPCRNEIYRSAWVRKREWKWIVVLCCLLSMTLCSCARMGCGKWHLMKRLLPFWLCLRLPQSIPPRRSFKRHWQAVVKTISAPL